MREHSTKLREGLDMLPPVYDWIIMDVPNQFDNLAELGLIAADVLLLPVELTGDCSERVASVLRIVDEAKSLNPRLAVLGVLALASAPRAGQELKLTALPVQHRQLSQTTSPFQEVDYAPSDVTGREVSGVINGSCMRRPDLAGVEARLSSNSVPSRQYRNSSAPFSNVLSSGLDLKATRSAASV
ncbi:MAG: hypothetical protein HY000_18900 [Planctomycetes bacterium]|nr:hypothetical protein [Planctomycetota bacterium]